MGSPGARFIAAAFAYWRAASTAQRILFVTGSALLASMLVHGAALVATGLELRGPVSFRKAMTFAETGWLLCWAVGWLLPLISLHRWERGMVVAGTWCFAVIETVVMSTQVWRGRPSHYNTATPADLLLIGTGGVVAALFMAAMLVLLAAARREHRLAPSLLLAIRAGITILLIGVFTGWLMIYNWGGVWQGWFRHGQRPQRRPGSDRHRRCRRRYGACARPWRAWPEPCSAGRLAAHLQCVVRAVALPHHRHRHGQYRDDPSCVHPWHVSITAYRFLGSGRARAAGCCRHGPAGELCACGLAGAQGNNAVHAGHRVSRARSVSRTLEVPYETHRSNK